jgi:hypothetical protein
MKSAVPEKLKKWNPGATYPGMTMPATMVSYAAIPPSGLAAVTRQPEKAAGPLFLSERTVSLLAGSGKIQQVSSSQKLIPKQTFTTPLQHGGTGQ